MVASPFWLANPLSYQKKTGEVNIPIKFAKDDVSCMKLGYAVTGGLWAAASFLSFMVTICNFVPFLYTFVQV
jgi:hypothetical protein